MGRGSRGERAQVTAMPKRGRRSRAKSWVPPYTLCGITYTCTHVSRDGHAREASAVYTVISRAQKAQQRSGNCRHARGRHVRVIPGCAVSGGTARRGGRRARARARLCASPRSGTWGSPNASTSTPIPHPMWTPATQTPTPRVRECPHIAARLDKQLGVLQRGGAEYGVEAERGTGERGQRRAVRGGGKAKGARGVDGHR